MNTLITYIILTGIANLFINCWLLHIIEEPRTRDFAINHGAIQFYIITFCIGCAMIPVLIIYVIGNFLKK